MDDLVALVTQNTQAIYDRLRNMYAYEIEQTGEQDERTVPNLQVRPCPTQVLNRSAWLWLRETLVELQRQVNLVVDLYNYANYIDQGTYTITPAVTIKIPTSLVIDTSVLTAEFGKINSLLDQLDRYAHLVEGGN